MFSNSKTVVESFIPHQTNTKKQLSDVEIQTEECVYAEVQIQAVRRKTVKLQVEQENCITFSNEDTDKLVDFLRCVEPLLTSELQKSNESTALDGYIPDYDQTDSNDVKHIHALSQDAVEDLSATDVSWNSTGSVIAASYGRLDHEHWCNHKAVVCTWNLERKSLQETKPDTVIDISSCCLCVRFHPTLPSILAGGTFSGEVHVWDLSSDNELVATCAFGVGSHKDPVTKVRWVRDPDRVSRGKFMLVSTSQDGKILFWRIAKGSIDLQLYKGFLLTASNLPRFLRSRLTRPGQEVGITCLSVCDHETFVVGTEAGAVFKCSIESQKRIGTLTDAEFPEALSDPVEMYLNAHDGPAYGVACSPHERNLLLSCSSDGQLYLRSLLQSTPVLQIEQNCGHLYNCTWSSTRPLVFAVASDAGLLIVFDLAKNLSAPILRLEAPEVSGVTSKPAFSSTQFNHEQPKLIAAGSSSGKVHIWQLSNDINLPGSVKDQQVLQTLLSPNTNEH